MLRRFLWNLRSSAVTLGLFCFSHTLRSVSLTELNDKWPFCPTAESLCKILTHIEFQAPMRCQFWDIRDSLRENVTVNADRQTFWLSHTLIWAIFQIVLFIIHSNTLLFMFLGGKYGPFGDFFFCRLTLTGVFSNTECFVLMCFHSY